MVQDIKWLLFLMQMDKQLEWSIFIYKKTIVHPGTIRTGGIIGCQDVILSFKIDNQTNKVSEIALICY